MTTALRPATRVGRIPSSEHADGRWRIRELTADFELEDLWALPATGGRHDFPRLLDVMRTIDLADGSPPTRLVWKVRDLLGEWFGLGRVIVPDGAGTEPTLPIPDSTSTTLADRLPHDLVGTIDATTASAHAPFRPLYLTEREFAAEISNRTVHGIMHLGWAYLGHDLYQAQMAVYVKPRGALGSMYMAAIKPFRYALVYPELMRLIDRSWRRQIGEIGRTMPKQPAATG